MEIGSAVHDPARDLPLHAGRWARPRLLRGPALVGPCPPPARTRAGRTKELPRTAPPLFHLAFPVTDLARARAFYGDLLGCPEGRSSDAWVDFDFFGHQVVAHLAPDEAGHRVTSAVDGKQVPVRHFGVILEMGAWEPLAEKLRAAGVEFVIEPYVRFRGQPGEQATMFLLDPCGNALEFKAFADMSRVFATT